MPPWLVRTDLLYPAADGADGVLKTVRQIIKMNTDWIKFTATGGATVNTWDKQQFNDEEIRTLINEAHDKGRPVACHAVWGKGALASAKYGVDSIEHGCELDDGLVDLMIKKNIFLVPTLYVPQLVAKRGADFGFTPEALENLKTAASKHGKSFRRALKAGVKIAMGTDGGYGPVQHGTNAYELELMVENGMTPMQAILSATKTAAECLRIDDRTGTIERGKWADILVVDGDPLEDITILQNKENIRVVMKDGKIFLNRVG
jgi:imidazolonepropionase-like amidohydrolase